MNNDKLKTFLKMCVAEVIVEPPARPVRKINGFHSFIKSCIAEVITEPTPRMTKVYGNPRQLQATHLIKECILEVLKDNLTEGGFDPQSQAGPNSPEGSDGNPYAAWNAEMRTMDEDAVTPEVSHDAKYYFSQLDERGAIIVRLKIQGYTFDQIGKKFGVTHERIREIYNSAINKLKRLAQREKEFSGKPADPTKFLAPKSQEIKETDPHGRYAQEAGAGQFDPRSFGNLTETIIKYPCPHCSKTTRILVEIESPSDYIACADCEHCGKEINSPKLDRKIYTEVITHYSGIKKKVLNEATLPKYWKEYISSVYGPDYAYVGKSSRPGKEIFNFKPFADAKHQTNLYVIYTKDGVFVGPSTDPNVLTPVNPVPINGVDVPAPPPISPPMVYKIPFPPKPPTPPTPPKPKLPTHSIKDPNYLLNAYRNLQSGSSGNSELDGWISKVELNSREKAVLCMRNRGYSVAQIAKLLNLKTSRVETMLQVATKIIQQVVKPSLK